MAIDWSKAPEGAEFYAKGDFRLNDSGYIFVFSSNLKRWIPSVESFEECVMFDDYCERPQQWPETDERINNIGLNRTEDDMGHYDQEREVEEAKKKEIEKCQEEVRAGYDRKIIGKYGSGACTVDIYRVLDAYKTGSSAIDHAIKKLLCAGNRGYKDKRKDYMEAIQSISQELSLIDDKSKL